MPQVKPAIYVTYNGDYFDWPFIETRAAMHGMDMFREIGFKMDKPGGNCLSQCVALPCWTPRIVCKLTINSIRRLADIPFQVLKPCNLLAGLACTWTAWRG